MFQRFTRDARLAIARARTEALRLGQPYTGSEHLLLGVVGGRGPGALALDVVGVTAARIEGLVRELRAHPEPLELEGGQLPYTHGAREVLVAGGRAARKASDPRGDVDCGHLLVALLTVEDTLASRVLARLGVIHGELRWAVERSRKLGPLPARAAEARPYKPLPALLRPPQLQAPLHPQMLARIAGALPAASALPSPGDLPSLTPARWLGPTLPPPRPLPLGPHPFLAPRVRALPAPALRALPAGIPALPAGIPALPAGIPALPAGEHDASLGWPGLHACLLALAGQRDDALAALRGLLARSGLARDALRRVGVEPARLYCAARDEGARVVACPSGAQVRVQTSGAGDAQLSPDRLLRAQDWPALRELIDELLATGVRWVVLDAVHVAYAESMLLGGMVAITDALRREGGGFALARPRPQLGLVLEMLGLKDLVQQSPDLDAAWRALGRAAPRPRPTPSLELAARIAQAEGAGGDEALLIGLVAALPGASEHLRRAEVEPDQLRRSLVLARGLADAPDPAAALRSFDREVARRPESAPAPSGASGVGLALLGALASLVGLWLSGCLG
ncbi:MAG: Clp protease N-terminal domain-containing protein [Planctomycetota bacterium]